MTHQAMNWEVQPYLKRSAHVLGRSSTTREGWEIRGFL